MARELNKTTLQEVLDMDFILWETLETMFIKFRLIKGEIVLKHQDYILIFGRAYNYFYYLHKDKFDLTIKAVREDPNKVDMLLETVKEISDYRNLVAEQIGGAIRHAITMIENNELFFVQMFTFFEEKGFDFMESMKLIALRNKPYLTVLEKFASGCQGTLKTLALEAVKCMQETQEITDKNLTDFHLEMIRSEFFTVRVLYNDMSSGTCNNENNKNLILKLEKVWDKMKLRDFNTFWKYNPKLDLEEKEDSFAIKKSGKILEIEKYANECEKEMKRFMSEACSEDELPEELKNSKVAKFCVSAREEQIKKRNKKRAYLSSRETSPKNQRVRNIKRRNKHDSAYLSGYSRKNFRKQLQTENLLGRKADPKKLEVINSMRKNYEIGYTPSKDEREKDKFYLENYCESLTNVPEGESLARVSFLIWCCQSCSAFFYEQHTYCPLCESIPKKQYLEKRHINYRTAKSFINSLSGSFLKSNKKLGESRLQNKKNSEELGKLKSEIENLKKESDEKTLKLTENSKKIQSLNLENSEVSKKLKEKEKECTENEKKLENKKKDFDEQRKIKNEALNKIAGYRDKYYNVINEKEKFLKTLSDNEVQLEKLTEKNEIITVLSLKLKEKASNLTKKLSNSNTEKEKLKELRELNEEKMKEKIQENESLKKEYEKIRSECEKVSGELKECQLQKKNLVFEKEDLENKLYNENLENEKKFNKMEQEKLALKSELEESRNLADSKNEEIKKLREKREEEFKVNKKNALKIKRRALEQVDCMENNFDSIKLRIKKLESRSVVAFDTRRKLNEEKRSRVLFFLLHCILAVLTMVYMSIGYISEVSFFEDFFWYTVRFFLPKWEFVPT